MPEPSKPVTPEEALLAAAAALEMATNPTGWGDRSFRRAVKERAEKLIRWVREEPAPRAKGRSRKAADRETPR